MAPLCIESNYVPELNWKGSFSQAYGMWAYLDKLQGVIFSNASESYFVYPCVYWKTCLG